MCKTRFGMTESETGAALGAPKIFVFLPLYECNLIVSLRTLGFIVGCYYIAQFVSSFLIGHLSDRVGRRLPLTMGQVASCIGTVAFALAPSYPIALLIRAAVGACAFLASSSDFGATFLNGIAGLTNSNIAVARAAICDAAVGKARTLSLSYMGSLYALSRAVASFVRRRRGSICCS